VSGFFDDGFFRASVVRLCGRDTMSDNARLTSVVFRLDRDKLDALKDLSRSTRIRQSEYLREAISDLLAKYSGDLQTE
jgi:hypothetical protein